MLRPKVIWALGLIVLASVLWVLTFASSAHATPCPFGSLQDYFNLNMTAGCSVGDVTFSNFTGSRVPSGFPFPLTDIGTYGVHPDNIPSNPGLIFFGPLIAGSNESIADTIAYNVSPIPGSAVQDASLTLHPVITATGTGTFNGSANLSNGSNLSTFVTSNSSDLSASSNFAPVSTLSTTLHFDWNGGSNGSILVSPNDAAGNDAGFSVDYSVTPEPSTAALMIPGMFPIVLAYLRRRAATKRQSQQE